MLASNQLKQLVTDWYVFNESAATLRQTGAIGDVAAGDAEFVVQSAVLFPTAPDGIRGEIALTRYPFADVLAGRVPAPAPARADRSPTFPSTSSRTAGCSTASSRRSLPATSRDARSPPTTAPPSASTTPPRPATGVPASRRTTATARRAVSSTLFAGADDLTLSGRLVTEWYVFAEYLRRSRFDGGGRRLRRVAAMHPLRDGRFDGTFGYGLDRQS